MNTAIKITTVGIGFPLLEKLGRIAEADSMNKREVLERLINERYQKLFYKKHTFGEALAKFEKENPIKPIPGYAPVPNADYEAELETSFADEY